MKTAGHVRFRYRLRDGTIVAGTTTVVALLAKPQLIKWANNLGLDGIDSAKFTDNLAEVGKLAHQLIADDLRGLETCLFDYSENQIEAAQNCVQSYTNWAAQHNTIEPIIIEGPQVSEDYRFGGTLDLYAAVDGIKTLVDFKSTNGIWPEHIIQVAAYRKLLQENGHKVEQVRILNIPRSGTENFQELIVSTETLDLNFEIFTHLLKIYELRKQLK